ncbi:MAG: MBL fold metallo-hydrolase [Candidatus Dormibacterales bacterium]
MSEGAAPLPVLDEGGVLIHQVRTPELGDSSYLVRAGEEVAVVDVQRDLDRFRRALAEIGGRVAAVVETHIHNDYVTGGAALAAEMGVPYVVAAGSGYEGGHRPVREGDTLEVGPARLRAMFTPGHTPHHMSYQVLVGGRVLAVLSGGCVLLGACGRTDLVSPGRTEELARLQHSSARRIGALPGPTGIGPTHGAGSFCSGAVGAEETWTTVAEERGRNPAFLLGEDAFARSQTAGLPAHPSYYRRMAPINKSSPAGWAPSPIPRVDLATLAGMMGGGVAVVDGRPRAEFATGHLRGSVSIEFGDLFSAYAGWVLPFGTPMALVGHEAEVRLAARQCARIGIEGIRAWSRASDGGPQEESRVTSFPVVDMGGLEAAWRAGATVLDVRDPTEWREGHIPGAVNVHVPLIPERLEEVRSLPLPVLVHCATGFRAAIASSLLDAAGVEVVLVDADFEGWGGRGLPLQKA